jgi:hypothetical protein
MTSANSSRRSSLTSVPPDPGIEGEDTYLERRSDVIASAHGAEELVRFTLKHYKIEELLVQSFSITAGYMRSHASTQSQASGRMSLSRKESLKKGRSRRRATLQGNAIIVSAPLVMNQTFRQDTTAFGRRRVPRLARMQHVPVIIGTLKAICQLPTGLGTATPIKVSGGGLSIKDVVQGR